MGTIQEDCETGISDEYFHYCVLLLFFFVSSIVHILINKKTKNCSTQPEIANKDDAGACARQTIQEDFLKPEFPANIFIITCCYFCLPFLPLFIVFSFAKKLKTVPRRLRITMTPVFARDRRADRRLVRRLRAPEQRAARRRRRGQLGSAVDARVTLRRPRLRQLRQRTPLPRRQARHGHARTYERRGRGCGSEVVTTRVVGGQPCVSEVDITPSNL